MSTRDIFKPSGEWGIDLTIPDGHKEQLRSAISKRYRNQFWIAFGVFSAFMLVIILVFLMLKESRIWYSSEPWYPFLYVLKELFPWIIAVIWIGGVALILFSQWRRSASDIVTLVDSIEMMQNGREGSVIAAPANLPELQPVMQALFDNAQRDKRVAEEAEQRKNDLVLYLAHDLKTPLTSTIGYLNLLSESNDLDGEKQQAYIKIALDKAVRLESLVEQFSEISRLDLQGITLEKSHFSLRLLIDQMADEFLPLLESSKKTLELMFDGDIVFFGDARLLARALSNIFQNAISYGESHSEITIDVKQVLDSVVITIANMGETIEPEQLEKIFEKFYRLDESRTSASGGSGLGLAIAREIITQHGGTITASSNYGKTEFSITLPM